MLIDHARLLLMSFVFALLASCGGSSNDDDDPPPPVGNASLAVTIAGLPAGLTAPVSIAGPAGYQRELTASATLTGLVAGSYTVNAQSAIGATAVYRPAVPGQTIAVAAGASATVAINYSAAPLSLGLREVARVDGAVFAAAPDDDARLFIVARDGRIRILRDGALLTLPFLDISGRLSTQGEGGLLSMAFDPQFSRNGFFYLYYTDFERNIVVVRYTVSPNRDIADPTSGLQIISIPHPFYTNHYGGLAAFGTDGFLYLGTGDGGGAGDPLGNAQDFTSLLGKVLRIDVSNASISRRYTIPPGNPYIGMASRRAEIWAGGLRNPWRFDIDSSGLYIADAGQDRREEINIASVSRAGLNYGWNIMEGSLCFTDPLCNKTGLTMPAFEYDHGNNDINGCSVIGGYVYRGTALPELAGRYFYSDFCGGFLKSLRSSDNGDTVGEQVAWTIPLIGNVVSFGRDGDGELYMVAADGRVYKIIRSAATAG